MGPGGICFVETDEDLTDINFFRMFRIVGAAESCPAAAAEKRQADLRLTVDQGVPDQILQGAPDRFFIAVYHQVTAAEISGRLNSFFLKIIIKRKHSVADAFAEIHFFRLQFIVGILEPGVGEQLFQHVFQTFNTGLDHGNIMIPFFF